MLSFATSSQSSGPSMTPIVGGRPTMTDPRQLCAGAPRRAGPVSLPFIGDASIVANSELTAAVSPRRSILSDDAIDGSNDGPHERLAATSQGSDVDHTNGTSLAFPGFQPLRYRLTDEATHYLVSERRWSNQDDSEDTVGQKNTIIIFVCFATIEECLVDKKSGKLLPVAGPFQALIDTLDMRYNLNGTHCDHKLLSAIRGAFVRSRHDEIKRRLAIGSGSLAEPNGLSGLGKMLLNVVDRHIAFLRTKKPLTHLCVPIPLDKVLGLRLIQIKNQLRDKACIEKCFTTFVPTIPANEKTNEKTSWQRSRRDTAEDDAQAEYNVEASSAAVDPNHGPEVISEALRDRKTAAGDNPHPKTPGKSVNGPARPSHPTPAPSAWHPDALSGLQLFKAAASEVHQIIRFSKDNTNLRNFINQIEEDVKEFQKTLQPQPQSIPARVDSAGDPRPQLGVSLDPECIRSLMLIGLLLINQKWNDQNLTDDARQTIVGDILEELHMIKEAVDHVNTTRA